MRAHALNILSALMIQIIPIIQNLPMGEQEQFPNYLTPLRNSASVTAVAIATFRLSEVSASAG